MTPSVALPVVSALLLEVTRADVTRMLRADALKLGLGVLLIVVGAIHLIITPLFAAFIEHQVPARAWAVIGPPTILNHVVVGVLLLPVGAAAIAAGRALHERWAWRLAWIIGLAAAALPAALVALMTGPNYNAVPFRIAEILVTLVGLAMPATLLWAWRAHRSLPP